MHTYIYIYIYIRTYTHALITCTEINTHIHTLRSSKENRPSPLTTYIPDKMADSHLNPVIFFVIIIIDISNISRGGVVRVQTM